MGKSAIKSDKKRRALSVEEIRRLLDKAPRGRRTIYLFLAFTGLRRGEAKAIRWCHARLDVANPVLDLPPEITKSGKAESLPLVPVVAEALRRHRGDARGSDPVFERIPDMDEFRADLAAAGIAEQDDRGRKVVLHSLRHSLATMLAQSQVPPAVAMKMLRHRDIRLTLETYTDESLLPLAAAMNTLPALTSGNMF